MIRLNRWLKEDCDDGWLMDDVSDVTMTVMMVDLMPVMMVDSMADLKAKMIAD